MKHTNNRPNIKVGKDAEENGSKHVDLRKVSSKLVNLVKGRVGKKC